MLYPPCADRAGLKADEMGDCFVSFFGSYIPPVSFTLYITAISVILQVFVFISCGALADYSRWRKVLLLGFSTVSSLMCILVLAVIKPGMSIIQKMMIMMIL
jgi:MFS-type transporter involved in bile tolerance (Atg22 family)